MPNRRVDGRNDVQAGSIRDLQQLARFLKCFGKVEHTKFEPVAAVPPILEKDAVSKAYVSS